MNEPEMIIEYFNYLELNDILYKTVDDIFDVDANESFVKIYFTKYGDYSVIKKIFLKKLKALFEIKNNTFTINLKEVNKLFIEYFKNIYCVLMSDLNYLCSYSLNNPFFLFKDKIKTTEINHFFSIFSLEDFFDKNLSDNNNIGDDFRTYFNKIDFIHCVKVYLLNLFNRLNYFFRYNYIKKSNIAKLYGINAAKSILDAYISEVLNEVNRINNIYMIYLESEPFPVITEFKNKSSIDGDDLYF